MAVSARRALWIHQWNADADSKKNMEALPFKGSVLFGDGLADLVSTATADSLEDYLQETKTIESKKQKSLHDFHFSGDEESLGKLSFIKSKKQTDINSSKQQDHSVITNDINKGDYKHALPKSPDKEGTPTPKPRESRRKHVPSPEGVSASVFEESLKPTPQHRNLLKKSTHLEDKAEEKQPSTKLSSLSAPSSLTRLNDTVPVSEKQSFSERCSPEGYRLPNPPSPPSQFKSLSITRDDNYEKITRESVLLKDLQMGEVDGPGSTESHGNGTKSASVLDMMLMDVKEKSMKQEDKVPIPEENRASHSSSDHNLWGNHGRLNQNHRQQKLDPPKDSELSSELGRSKSSSKKRSTKQNTPKARYLGTLTILDKSVNDNNCEVEAADTLRAAVYQNWLEKKKVFVHELHQLKKAKAEQEKEKIKMESTMKKEEAMAAFMAWKTEKKKETKQNEMKQKLEQKKKMDEIQEIASKKEDCRKAFEKWKEAKEDYLREITLKQKLTEMEKNRQEQTMKMEKTNDSKSAFIKWNERKEHVLTEKKKQERSEKRKLEKIKAEKEEQERKAQELYEKWLKRKERQELMEKKQKRLQVILDDDGPPPWSPPGNTISAGR
ncbi:microtubule-associated protein 9 isoform X2 [Pseudophryne corroboree]|uniref:microtubule-associated protein 9 isoform X2 n=1 Tax=Pseudophryne corroboree TaxID=495146 RepID=UPI003081BCA1